MEQKWNTTTIGLGDHPVRRLTIYQDTLGEGNTLPAYWVSFMDIVCVLFCSLSKDCKFTEDSTCIIRATKCLEMLYKFELDDFGLISVINSLKSYLCERLEENQ